MQDEAGNAEAAELQATGALFIETYRSPVELHERPTWQIESKFRANSFS